MVDELRICLKNYDLIDPENIEDYLQRGGYQALKKALGMQPADLVNEVKESGLRGRVGPGLIPALNGALP